MNESKYIWKEIKNQIIGEEQHNNPRFWLDKNGIPTSCSDHEFSARVK
jgi:hypothetical protein